MAIKIGSHLGEETLELYALGRLPEHLIPALEEHILLCETCRDRLDEAESFVQVVATAARELREDEAKAKPRNLLSRLAWLWTVPTPVWVGTVAAAALLVAIPYSRVESPPSITEVRMETTDRGVADQLIAPAKAGKVVLLLDIRQLDDLPVYGLQLVSSEGAEIWAGTATASNHELRVAVPVTLSAGDYWVRLNKRDGTNLRELGLKVK